MTITTGNQGYEILQSGTLITFKDEVLTFHLSEELRISLTFVTDKSDKGTRIEYKPVNERELSLVLINFNDSLGGGNSLPLPLATLRNKRIYLNLVVYAFNEVSNKTIHYTWYQREEVTNG